MSLRGVDFGFVRANQLAFVVTRLEPGSQAETLGLACGDWIAEYRGIRVRSAEHLRALMDRKSTGAKVSLLIVRSRRQLVSDQAQGPSV
jgi:S1-C subfamily serine protease